MSSRIDCIENSEVSNNDVLLGRGALLDRFEGNVQFRALVRAHWATYRASVTTYAQRQQVVRRVLDTVQANGGRFLRRVPTTTVPDDRQSDNNGQPQWEVVDKAVATEKVKQSFRDLNHVAAKSHRKSIAKVPMASSSEAERIIPSPATVPAQSQTTESSTDAVSSLVGTATAAFQTRPAAASMIGAAPDMSIPIDSFLSSTNPSIHYQADTVWQTASDPATRRALDDPAAYEHGGSNSLQAALNSMHFSSLHTGNQPTIPFDWAVPAAPGSLPRSSLDEPVATTPETLAAAHWLLSSTQSHTAPGRITHPSFSAQQSAWLANWAHSHRSNQQDSSGIAIDRDASQTLFDLSRARATTTTESHASVAPSVEARMFVPRNPHELEDVYGSRSLRTLLLERELLPFNSGDHSTRMQFPTASHDINNPSVHLPSSSVLALGGTPESRLWPHVPHSRRPRNGIDDTLLLWWRQVPQRYITLLPLVQSGIVRPLTGSDLQALRDCLVYARAARDFECLRQIQTAMLSIVNLPPSRLELESADIEYLLGTIRSLS